MVLGQVVSGFLRCHTFGTLQGEKLRVPVHRYHPAKSPAPAVLGVGRPGASPPAASAPPTTGTDSFRGTSPGSSVAASTVHLAHPAALPAGQVVAAAASVAPAHAVEPIRPAELAIGAPHALELIGPDEPITVAAAAPGAHHEAASPAANTLHSGAYLAQIPTTCTAGMVSSQQVPETSVQVASHPAESGAEHQLLCDETDAVRDAINALGGPLKSRAQMKASVEDRGFLMRAVLGWMCLHGVAGKMHCKPVGLQASQKSKVPLLGLLAKENAGLCKQVVQCDVFKHAMSDSLQLRPKHESVFRNQGGFTARFKFMKGLFMEMLVYFCAYKGDLHPPNLRLLAEGQEVAWEWAALQPAPSLSGNESEQFLCFAENWAKKSWHCVQITPQGRKEVDCPWMVFVSGVMTTKTQQAVYCRLGSGRVLECQVSDRHQLDRHADLPDSLKTAEKSRCSKRKRYDSGMSTDENTDSE